MMTVLIFSSNFDSDNDSDSPPPPHSKSTKYPSPNKNKYNSKFKPRFKTKCLYLESKNTMQRSLPLTYTSLSVFLHLTHL